MRKMFPLIFFLLVSVSAHAKNCADSVSIPIQATSVIYSGLDKDMPKDACFRFSVDDTGLHAPRDLDEAEDQIITVMPHWIYRAVQESYGDRKCVVMVNKLDYFGLLINYFIDKWKVVGIDISKFGGVGSQAQDAFQDKIQESICEKIKKQTGE